MTSTNQNDFSQEKVRKNNLLQTVPLMVTQLEQCRQAVLTAGKRLLVSDGIIVEEKTDYTNLVTKYDKATQEYLVETFSKIVPEATFLCEEEDMADTSGAYVFIIDPIDGTANFTKYFGHSAISVALAREGKLLWGAVYNPFTEDFFEARAEEGAYHNGKRIHVSEDSLKHSLVAFGTSPYYRELRDESFRIALDVMDHALDIRRSGSAALDLCYAACGRCGVFFELKLSPWDFAAGMLIVQEAGGVITDIHGNTPDFTAKSSIVAGNKKAHQEFMKLYGK